MKRVNFINSIRPLLFILAFCNLFNSTYGQDPRIIKQKDPELLKERSSRSQNKNTTNAIIQVFSQVDASGRILLFMLEPEGYVSYIPQVEKNGAWGTVKKIGENVKISKSNPGSPVQLRQPPSFKALFSELATGRNSQNRVVLLGLTFSGAAYYSIQDKFEPENWSEWEKLSNPGFTHITAIQNSNGLLQLFGVTGLGDVFYSMENFDPLDPQKFTAWKSMNALDLDQIVCEKSSSGLVVVFAKNKINGSVYHNWQMQPGSETWSGWSPLEGYELKSINVNKNPDGRLTLLAVGGDQRLYERYQLIPEGSWSEWATQDGSTIKQIVSERSKAGRITVFALHDKGSVDVIWQLGPGGNTWSGWYPFGGDSFRYIISSRQEDGRMILFAVDGKFHIQYTSQQSPDGAWDGWKNLY